MNFVDVKAKTVDEAVAIALEKLGAKKDDVNIEVLEESKGLFGILGSKEVLVRVSVIEKEAPPEPAEEEKPAAVSSSDMPREISQAEDFLSSIIKKMDIDASFTTSYDEKTAQAFIDIEGKDVGIMIGRHGETLDAVQYLANVVANKKSRDFVKITLDAENYREKRKTTLVNLANKTARKAVKYARNMTIEPMNPYERRIIHEALQGYPGVTTYSVGNEPNRKVVVAYEPSGSAQDFDGE